MRFGSKLVTVTSLRLVNLVYSIAAEDGPVAAVAGTKAATTDPEVSVIES